MTVHPFEEQLRNAVHEAARAAFTRLFRERPTDRFYYCTLVMPGELFTVSVAAWSDEALDAALPAFKFSTREDLQYSFVDSPFLGYGEELFAEVRSLLRGRVALHELNDVELEEELALRLRAIEAAMARLDDEGLFGTGPARLGVVIGVELMPPDWTNTERVKRLNAPEAIERWMAIAAEPVPEA